MVRLFRFHVYRLVRFRTNAIFRLRFGHRKRPDSARGGASHLYRDWFRNYRRPETYTTAVIGSAVRSPRRPQLPSKVSQPSPLAGKGLWKSLKDEGQRLVVFGSDWRHSGRA